MDSLEFSRYIIVSFANRDNSILCFQRLELPFPSLVSLHCSVSQNSARLQAPFVYNCNQNAPNLLSRGALAFSIMYLPSLRSRYSFPPISLSFNVKHHGNPLWHLTGWLVTSVLWPARALFYMSGFSGVTAPGTPCSAAACYSLPPTELHLPLQPSQCALAVVIARPGVSFGHFSFEHQNTSFTGRIWKLSFFILPKQLE